METIQSLNQELGLSFGFSPIHDDVGAYVAQGAALPNYCWMRTRDLYFFMQDGNFQATPGSITLVLPKYKRYAWSLRIGDGWLVAKWGMPDMTRHAWEQSLGTQFQYPEQGRFVPIENTRLPEGSTPDLELTRWFMHCLNRQLNKTFSQLVEDAEAEGREPYEESKRQIADEVDDMFPAFMNIPGEKRDVSFPPVKKR